MYPVLYLHNGQHFQDQEKKKFSKNYKKGSRLLHFISFLTDPVDRRKRGWEGKGVEVQIDCHPCYLPSPQLAVLSAINLFHFQQQTYQENIQ
jgi:hypothetical protein